MNLLNLECKVRIDNPDAVEKKLSEIDPAYVGEDHQTDTYFNVPHGRLKLREGNIENALIYYERENIAATKRSDVILYPHQPDSTLKEMLSRVLGIKIVVEKVRKIYRKENVKFHIDRVKHLGTFFEVEAIDEKGTTGNQELKKQCNTYIAFFGFEEKDFVDRSYSDLLLERPRE